MIRYIKFVFLFIFIGLTSSGLAQKSGNTAGTSSLLLLRFEPSTRIAALGGAFTGLADDENAVFYNPSGLAYLNQGMVTLNHTEWFEDIRIENLFAGYNLSRKFGLGLGITHMWMPDIQGRDASGQTTQPITISSSIFSGAFAYQITDGFNAGLAIKYFMDNLGDYTASGVGFDFGLHLKTFISGLYTGLTVQNIGASISYYKEKQKLPLAFRLGAIYKIYSPKINILADVAKSVDSDPYLHFGLEYNFLDQFYARIGNQFVWNALFTPSLGIGYTLKDQFLFNYTFVLYSDLGAIHRLGFSFHFNTPATRKPGTSYTVPLTATNILLRPPDKVQVEIKESELIISWEQVPGGEYYVYSRHSSQTTWHKLNESPLKYHQMKFKKPKVSGKYFFRVNTVINKQESSSSKKVEIDVKE